MKGILYKEEEGYYVFVNTVILGTTRPLLNFDLVKYKLSLDNCEDIERDVPKNDLDGWDVEILMGTHCRQIDCVNEGELVKSKIVKDGEVPMLDKDGCLILRRI